MITTSAPDPVLVELQSQGPHGERPQRIGDGGIDLASLDTYRNLYPERGGQTSSEHDFTKGGVTWTAAARRWGYGSDLGYVFSNKVT
jgi:hypothetical protein